MDVLDFTCSPDDGAGQIVGIAPLEIRCVPELPVDGTWEQVVWTFGDGATAEGSTATHVYDGTGQFTVSVRLDGYVGPPSDTGTDTATDTGVLGTDPYAARYGYVSVCGPPEPEFTYEMVGGLDYVVQNHTPVSAHCLSELEWSVFRGTHIGGDPWRTFQIWEPTFTLPDEGPWTVVLTMSGIGGTRSARLEIDAEYGLTEKLDPGIQGACDSSGAAGLGLGALTLPLLLARRRAR